MKTFNELFDDFFKRNDIKPEDSIGDDISNEAKKLFEMLSNINDDEDISEVIENTFDETLGKPNKIEFFNEDELFFERRTWHTENGDLIKLLVSDDPSFGKMPKITKSLKEQLNEALQNEDYEKCAILQAEMDKKNETKK